MKLLIPVRASRSRPHRRLRLLKVALILGVIGSAIMLQWPVALAGLEGSAPPQTAEQQEFFEKKTRPLFVKNCQSCHNARVKTAGLDLSTPEGFMRGGDSGPLISREQPESSR